MRMAKQEQLDTKDDSPSGANAYKCEKCGATFSDSMMLEKHRKVHVSGGQGGGAVEIIPGAQPKEAPPSRPPSPTPEPSPSPGPQPVQA